MVAWGFIGAWHHVLVPLLIGVWDCQFAILTERFIVDCTIWHVGVVLVIVFQRPWLVLGMALRLKECVIDFLIMFWYNLKVDRLASCHGIVYCMISATRYVAGLSILFDLWCPVGWHWLIIHVYHCALTARWLAVGHVFWAIRCVFDVPSW